MYFKMWTLKGVLNVWFISCRGCSVYPLWGPERGVRPERLWVAVHGDSYEPCVKTMVLWSGMKTISADQNSCYSSVRNSSSGIYVRGADSLNSVVLWLLLYIKPRECSIYCNAAVLDCISLYKYCLCPLSVFTFNPWVGLNPSVRQLLKQTRGNKWGKSLVIDALVEVKQQTETA